MMGQTSSTKGLQIATIKTVFSSLNNDEQAILIEDLMKMAKIDSMINVNDPTIFAGIEIPAPIETTEEKELRLYRKNFTKWLMPFFCKFLKIIDSEYLQQCFEIYLLLEEKSLSSQRIGLEESRDCFLTACLAYNGSRYNFHSDEEKRKMFRGSDNQIVDQIFGEVDPELMNIFRILSEDYTVSTTFTDLIVLLHNDCKRAKLLLYILGYLPEQASEEKESFLLMFPEIESIKEMASSSESIQRLQKAFPDIHMY